LRQPLPLTISEYLYGLCQTNVMEGCINKQGEMHISFPEASGGQA
jgi:hypothetical protein